MGNQRHIMHTICKLQERCTLKLDNGSLTTGTPSFFEFGPYEGCEHFQWHADGTDFLDVIALEDVRSVQIEFNTTH